MKKNSDINRLDPHPRDILGTDLDAARSYLVAALAAPGEGRVDATRDEVVATIADIEPRRWRATMSAELQTFAADLSGRITVADTDLAILLCSDTAEGLVAGLWNAVALAGADLDQVHYLDDATTQFDRKPGNVVIVRIPGMHIGDEDGFRKAMRAVGHLGQNLVAGTATWRAEVRCYLSGGYKAAIPYLIGMAEGLRSTEKLGRVQALVIHEDAGILAQPIRLPLRRFVRGQMELELKDFDSDGKRHQAPIDDIFDGYAYEEGPPGTWRLTPFGEGLRVLLHRAQGHGG